MANTHTVRVGLGENSYDIRIGSGTLRTLGDIVKRQETSGRVMVVSDETVWGYYRDAFEAAMREAALAFDTAILPPGEANKSMAGLARLYEAFADHRLRRSGLVIAFGGGVIGDLAGFAAATYMRGVRFLQVPTTLLAQVDSSVGGKTAINLPQGKNLVGAFYQPKAVLIDTDTLRTVSKRDWRGGMAEVIKYGAIRSAALFEQLHTVGGPDACQDIIAQCCGIKAEIVMRDEHDYGERMLLNFGHTFGHAVEKLYQFERYNHGEAVAVGMRIAAAAGEALGVTEPGCERRLAQLLRLHGLDTSCPFALGALLPFLELDKKNLTDGVTLVLLSAIGEAFTKTIGFNELAEVLERVEQQWKNQE